MKDKDVLLAFEAQEMMSPEPEPWKDLPEERLPIFPTVLLPERWGKLITGLGLPGSLTLDRELPVGQVVRSSGLRAPSHEHGCGLPNPGCPHTDSQGNKHSLSTYCVHHPRPFSPMLGPSHLALSLSFSPPRMFFTQILLWLFLGFHQISAEKSPPPGGLL